jgi:hypothetical protein
MPGPEICRPSDYQFGNERTGCSLPAGSRLRCFVGEYPSGLLADRPIGDACFLLRDGETAEGPAWFWFRSPMSRHYRSTFWTIAARRHHLNVE